VTIAGNEIEYSFEAAAIPIVNAKGETTARVFYTYYRRTNDPNATNDKPRPIVFCFNGGPGSSSVWLHLGALGPRRIELPADGLTAPAPPYNIINNKESILDAVDLVFVDPVSTGFSEAADPEKTRAFLGYEEDISYLSEFIRRFISEKNLWHAPKYLLGESYGALRVTALGDELQNRHGMYLNGIVLLSGLLDFQTLTSHNGNDLPYIIYLPSLAAVAHFHGKLNPETSLEDAVAYASDLAYGDYANALLKGVNLSDEEWASVTNNLQTATGIDAELWKKANLRLSYRRFQNLLLSDEQQTLGRFDGRVTMPTDDPLANSPSSDPSMDVIWGAFSSGINDYLRRELSIPMPSAYRVLNPTGWNYEPFRNRYVQVSDRLQSALIKNPHLRILVQCGYHDLATPPAGVEHSISQLQLPDNLRENILTTYYPGGHMFYTIDESRAQSRDDLIEFFKTPEK